MRYPFKCEEHGRVEVTCPMSDVKKEMACPICGTMSVRIYEPPQIKSSGDWTTKKIKKIDTSQDWITRRQKDRWE